MVIKSLSPVIVILFLLFISCTSSIYCQSFNPEKTDSLIYSEVREFIDKVNNHYIRNSRYAVFILKGIESDSSNKSFVFSMSYMLNSYDYNKASSSHFFYINTNLVIVKNNNKFNIECLKMFDLKKITEIEQTLIQKKLFPQERGGITYSPQGLILTKHQNKVESVFYKHADFMPRDGLINQENPSGIMLKIK